MNGRDSSLPCNRCSDEGIGGYVATVRTEEWCLIRREDLRGVGLGRGLGKKTMGGLVY